MSALCSWQRLQLRWIRIVNRSFLHHDKRSCVVKFISLNQHHYRQHAFRSVFNTGIPSFNYDTAIYTIYIQIWIVKWTIELASKQNNAEIQKHMFRLSSTYQLPLWRKIENHTELISHSAQFCCCCFCDCRSRHPEPFMSLLIPLFAHIRSGEVLVASEYQSIFNRMTWHDGAAFACSRMGTMGRHEIDLFPFFRSSPWFTNGCLCRLHRLFVAIQLQRSNVRICCIRRWSCSYWWPTGSVITTVFFYGISMNSSTPKFWQHASCRQLMVSILFHRTRTKRKYSLALQKKNLPAGSAKLRLKKYHVGHQFNYQQPTIWSIKIARRCGEIRLRPLQTNEPLHLLLA